MTDAPSPVDRINTLRVRLADLVDELHGDLLSDEVLVATASLLDDVTRARRVLAARYPGPTRETALLAGCSNGSVSHWRRAAKAGRL